MGKNQDAKRLFLVVIHLQKQKYLHIVRIVSGEKIKKIMSSQQNDKPIAFVMPLDEERAEALRTVFRTYFQARNVIGLDRLISDLRVPDASIIELWNVFIDRYHEMGWCKNPNCDYRKGHYTSM